MRRADQVAGLLLLAVAVGFTAVGLQYTYWGPTGPGSGFLPVWLGLTMGALALLLLVSASRARVAAESWLPGGRGLRRLLAVLTTTIVFVAALRVVGMILGTALFLLVLLRLVEGYSWRLSVGVAIGAAVVNYVVFTSWLRVPFPVGVLGF